MCLHASHGWLIIRSFIVARAKITTTLPETNAALISMAEAGVNLIMLLVILIFIKQLLTEHSIVSGKQGLLEIARNRTDKEKQKTSLEERFIQITSRPEWFLPTNLLCLTSRNCLCYAIIRLNRLEPSPMHAEDGKKIDILSFS